MTKLLTFTCALLVMTGCTSQPTETVPAEKPQPKGPEMVTGRVAFQKMYIAARSWANDAQPFRLQSETTADSKGKDGKSDLWRAWFASPARRSAKPFVWSGTDLPDAPPRGVNPGSEDNYSPNNTSTQVFDAAFLKVDSGAGSSKEQPVDAFNVAQKHGGNAVFEKAPDTPVFYVLDWSHANNQLIWHVIYGTSRDEAKWRVAVDATTGDFIRVEK
ncbi:MAG TPA: hypothetical protein VEK33_16070 [Terriglobales bacterium]|nr:hypothetical protein [Terriglobales bacterium]